MALAMAAFTTNDTITKAVLAELNIGHGDRRRHHPVLRPAPP
jgi:hypothetical protein